MLYGNFMTRMTPFFVTSFSRHNPLLHLSANNMSTQDLYSANVPDTPFPATCSLEVNTPMASWSVEKFEEFAKDPKNKTRCEALAPMLYTSYTSRDLLMDVSLLTFYKMFTRKTAIRLFRERPAKTLKVHVTNRF